MSAEHIPATLEQRFTDAQNSIEHLKKSNKSLAMHISMLQGQLKHANEQYAILNKKRTMKIKHETDVGMIRREVLMWKARAEKFENLLLRLVEKALEEK